MKMDIATIKQEIISVASDVKTNREQSDQFKILMGDYNVLTGQSQQFLSDPESFLEEQDLGTVIVYNMQLYETTKNPRVNPNRFFNEREIKEATTTFIGYEPEKEKFPFTFEKPAEKVHDGFYVLASVTELRRLSNGKLIQYNSNTQRNTKKKVGQDGRLIETPRVNTRSIKEIKELFRKGKLRSSELAFNARLGSGDEGEEIYYDEEERSLTILEGTLFDCIDGFHRLTATIEEQTSDTNLDMYFMLKVINATEAQAQEHFRQTNTINPVAKSHLKKMDKENLFNFATDFLERESELKGKIVTDNQVIPSSESLTTYRIISEAIEDNFKIDNRGEAVKVARYLTEFFNEISYTYVDGFLSNIAEVRKTSYINYPSMFSGYIVLAKRMYDMKIKIDRLTEILENIGFERGNSIWDDLLKNSHAKTVIDEYYTNYNLDKYNSEQVNVNV